MGALQLPRFTLDPDSFGASTLRSPASDPEQPNHFTIPDLPKLLLNLF
jgi:hypothetical protein